jgi:hypothetical protein
VIEVPDVATALRVLQVHERTKDALSAVPDF